MERHAIVVFRWSCSFSHRIGYGFLELYVIFVSEFVFSQDVGYSGDGRYLRCVPSFNIGNLFLRSAVLCYQGGGFPNRRFASKRFRVRPSVDNSRAKVCEYPIERRSAFGSPLLTWCVGIRPTIFNNVCPIRQVVTVRSHPCSYFLRDFSRHKGVGFLRHTFVRV